VAIYTANDQRALVATTTKSLILLIPVVKIMLVHVDISMDASAAAAGVRFDLYRVTSLGSAAGTNFTPVKYHPSDSASALTTTNCRVNLTVEPSSVEIIESWYVQPFGGLLPLDAVFDREIVGPPGGAGLGLRYVNPGGGSTANVAVGLSWAE
jgi:hypothetical protein